MPTPRCLHIIRDEHAALAAMLQSMRRLVQLGPDQSRPQFFDLLRAMLFYIDEYPERLHHPKESNLLFPRVLKASPKVLGAIDRLERDHLYSEKAARELQHQLLAWELLGASRRAGFEQAFERYVDFYLDHMQLEESIILPEAERMLVADDWVALDAAFEANADPLTGNYPPGADYERLFGQIVQRTPAPIGLG